MIKWFANLKTKTKLIISFSLFVFILVLVVVKSYLTIFTIAKNSDELNKNEFNLVERITKMDDDNNNIQRILLTMLFVKTKAEIDTLSTQLNLYVAEQNSLQDNISQTIKNDPKFMIHLTRLTEIKNQLTQIRDGQLIPAINLGDIPQAQKILFGIYMDQFNKMSELANTLVNEAREKVLNAVAQSNREVNKAAFFLIGMLLSAVIISIILIILLNRLISYPINEISKMAKKIANGELNISPHTHNVKVDRQDEIGILNCAFKTMAQNIKVMMKEISDIIDVLNESSTEIASAVSQLSASAAETATSINETTSTIEEVKQTSLVASQKSKEVAESAQKTSSVSQTGKIATEEINEVISNIHNQMSAISETMMRLNEQGQTIAAIITTVEDLAQQTNLLAVNAAIEASKAGEQGKGFSVVAHEIKNLANQSKQATTQVRSILSDIQKATSAAVMATDLGSKAVESGVKKTEDAGISIISLINTVKESSMVASQIDAVTHQQLIGMEQAVVAMENIKEASSQNVESTHLLKNSITQIKDLGERLKQLITQYKLK